MASQFHRATLRLQPAQHGGHIREGAAGAVPGVLRAGEQAVRDQVACHAQGVGGQHVLPPSA